MMANDLAPPRRMSTAIQSFVIRNKPTVEIVLHDQQDAYIHSYTTLDRIEGHVTIKFDKDTSFDDLSISFEGQSDTYVEKVSNQSTTQCTILTRFRLRQLPRLLGEQKANISS